MEGRAGAEKNHSFGGFAGGAASAKLLAGRKVAISSRNHQHNHARFARSAGYR